MKLEYVEKTALPVVLGRPVITRRRVQAFLSVKLHRVGQVHPLGDSRRTAAVFDIMSEIHKLGYPAPFICRALNGVRNLRILDLAALGQATMTHLSSARESA